VKPRSLLFDLPVVFNLEQATAGRSIPFAWKPDYRSCVGVLPRWGTNADVTWVDVDPCFVYHPLNAYDDGDRVVLDVCAQEQAFSGAPDDFMGTSPSLERWILDPVAGHVAIETLDERPQDFPRADERLAGLPHRFGDTLRENAFVSLGGLGDDPRTFLYEHDLVAGTHLEHGFDPGRIASEFVFVAAHDAAGEEEGYLMGYVWDRGTDRSDLVLLDARDFPREIARVHLPVRLPQGFHGNWMSDRVLA
jgi:carotenoid cleavage dioxygenase-like enzyme